MPTHPKAEYPSTLSSPTLYRWYPAEGALDPAAAHKLGVQDPELWEQAV